ncbi:hypothetical protein [Pseudomonas mucidolens]|uniref:Uncharacterized protein n=1 Tax=Pseudomonas mucidolens TaxID=46679 RepID=A0A1H2MRG2_9PSED|nr:hypothetical protein [Pseudomonas mucidolens]SDU95578.1 hypothetical protein SAMN05216202_2206 [Pseudomonas mucidolens]SQH33400.1 Uncharacterised protein [Pseudomonas mucidolens]
MQLESLELKALLNLLERFEHQSSEVIDRQPTPAGFFTIIRLGESVPRLSQKSERIWKFKHPKLCGGGFFVCWQVSDVELCLEAVSNSGRWPSDMLTAV